MDLVTPIDFVWPSPAVSEVASHFHSFDRLEERIGQVFRKTFDQLYDGPRTGRYKWDQLYKTEKTHYGTIFEINLQREFDLDDGVVLDYRIAGHEVDCKYSDKGQWMLPPEVFNRLFLACRASDLESTWSIGIVEARHDFLRASSNRDRKTGLNTDGRAAISWLFKDSPMPPNVLLQIPETTAERLVRGNKSGQKRVDDLFRTLTGRRITRNVLGTVAQQLDPLKRARGNGGSRTNLAPEGILILSGDYIAQADIAEQLGLERPLAGEFMSVRVGEGAPDTPYNALIDGRWWRQLRDDEQPTLPAPVVSIKRSLEA